MEPLDTPQPHPDLIRCEQLGYCNFCGKNLTYWRAKTFDIHICCLDCYTEACDLLQHLKPLAHLEPDINHTPPHVKG